MNLDYNRLFKWCVELLRYYAHEWHMTYEELNIWIFVIIEPIVFLLMLGLIVYLLVRCRKLKNAVRPIRMASK